MRRRPAALLAAALLAGALSPAAAPARAEEPPVVLLGAFDRETQPVVAALDRPAACSVPGVPCASGTLDGRRTIVLTTGIGKVNAAMTATLAIERFTPAAVVFTGVAGGIAPELAPGDVVFAERLLQHDLVVQGESGPVLRAVRDPSGVVRPTVMDASPLLLALARGLAPRLEPALERTGDGARPARLRAGTIVTGDAFVSADAKRDELRQRFLADAVEMEGAAVAHVCTLRGVPCLVVRGLSDRASGGASEEARRNTAIAARNAARVALAVAQAFAAAGGRR